MHSNRLTVGGPYLWERPDWLHDLRWRADVLAPVIAKVRRAQGRLAVRSVDIGRHDRAQTELSSLIQDTLSTARIEGEELQLESVRASVSHHLGQPYIGQRRRHIDGLVRVLLDARRAHDQPLTVQRLLAWHTHLFPHARSAVGPITVGAWRRGQAPMQVVSGIYGRNPLVHYEAPPSDQLERQMREFIEHNREQSRHGDTLVHAGVAHLTFVTIHPFDDGNGRIARAISDLHLSRDEGTTRRLWSMSTQIERDRSSYYAALQAAQRGDGDLTEWLGWFIGCALEGIQAAERTIEHTMHKRWFWTQPKTQQLNDRQRKLLRKLLDAEPGGFVGGMTTRKAASITKSSRATAQRDLADLLIKGLLLTLDGRGRSTAYKLATVGQRTTDPDFSG